MSYWIYILCSKRNGTLYIGVTGDLKKRIFEHKSKIIEGFTKKHNVDQLVYYEEFLDIREAINQEKLMKRWLRKWKLDLIEKFNPSWTDLYETL